MKLRSGKEYFFKKPNSEVVTKEKDRVPNFVINIAKYLKSQFAYAGYELYDMECSVVIETKKKRRLKRIIY